MRNLLPTALLAFCLPILLPAQETGATTESEPTRHERGDKPHKTIRKQVRSDVREQRQQRRDARPDGESKPTTDHRTPAERASHFLEQHPKVKQELMQKADADGDGKLSSEEKLAMKKMVAEHMALHHAAKKERIEARRADRQERRADGDHPLDRNGDGKVGPRELERARQIKQRVNRNDDGKVGPHEHKRARQIKQRVDRNDDGKVGPHEHKRAKQIKQRVDRNGDGKVGPREHKRAKRVRQKHND